MSRNGHDLDRDKNMKLRVHARFRLSAVRPEPLSDTVQRRKTLSVSNKREFCMKRISVLLLGVAILLTGLSSATAPAFALGACGPNYHRNAWGHCVWGGQNQGWCLRHR